MSDISEIVIGGESYSIKDTEARTTDLLLSDESSKPLANWVIKALMDEFAVNWTIDENNNARLINRNGDYIGDSLDITNSNVYKMRLYTWSPRADMIPSSQNYYWIDYEYYSQDDNDNDDGPGIGWIVVNGRSITDTFSVTQGYHELDIGPYLTSGDNVVKVHVENSENNVRELVFMISVVSLTIQCSLPSVSVVDGSFPVSFALDGPSGEKWASVRVYGFDIYGSYFSYEWWNDDPILDKGQHTAEIPNLLNRYEETDGGYIDFPPGVYTVQITASMETEDGSWFNYESTERTIILIDEPLPAIATASNQRVVRYFDAYGAYLFGYAALVGSAAINPVATGQIQTAPTKNDPYNECRYEFAGWENLPEHVTEDCYVIPKFNTMWSVVFWNNGDALSTVWVIEGENVAPPSTDPVRPDDSTNRYYFTGWGWASGGPATEDVLKNVTYYRNIYAVYRAEPLITVRFMIDSTVLQTVRVVAGEDAVYTGETPAISGTDWYEFTGWSPSPTNIQAATDCIAQFHDTRGLVAQYLGSGRNGGGGLAQYSSQTDTAIAPLAFYYQADLTSVTTSATSVGDQAFMYCTSLSVVDFTSTSPVTFSGGSIFQNTNSLKHIIIRSETVSTAQKALAFNTASKYFYNKQGYIYVPSDLVASYKTATNWTTHKGMFRPISAYPATDYSTITDSWAEIANNANWNTDYAQGDIKSVEIGGQKIYMELVAKNTDDLSEGGKARMTWLALEALYVTEGSGAPTQQTRLHKSTTVSGGWAACDLRTYLSDTVFEALPSELKSAIKTVDKTYRSKTPTDTTLTTQDKLWIPSMRETGLNTTYETSGGSYSSWLNGSARRTRYNTTDVDGGKAGLAWWTRTQTSSTAFGCVSSSGTSTSGSPNNSTNYAIIIGFCI